MAMLFMGSNRTFMELKFICILFFIFILTSSNRTFMELKLVVMLMTSDVTVSSNRTFMELKSQIIRHTYGSCKVLIVPLWN